MNLSTAGRGALAWAAVVAYVLSSDLAMDLGGWSITPVRLLLVLAAVALALRGGPGRPWFETGLRKTLVLTASVVVASAASSGLALGAAIVPSLSSVLGALVVRAAEATLLMAVFAPPLRLRSSRAALWTRPHVGDGVADRFARALAALVLLGIPFSIIVDLEVPGRTVASVRLPWVDALAWVAVAFELVLQLVRSPRGLRDDARRVLENPFAWFVVMALVSLLRPLGAVNDAVQLFDTYILGFWLFSRRRFGPRWFGGVGAILCAVAGLVAGYQMLSGEPHYRVRGVFENRSAFVAMLALSGPWCLGLHRRWGLLAVLVGVAGMASLAGTALVAATVAVGRASSPRSRRGWGPVGLVVLAGAIPLLLAPLELRQAMQAEPARMFRVPLEARRVEVLQERRAATPPPAHLTFPIGHRQVFLTFDGLTARGPLPAPSSPPESATWVVPEYFAQTWAALRLMGSQPLAAAGLGGWQRVIGTGYGALERTGTTFANVLPGHLLLAVTVGWLGLVAWLAAWVWSFRRALPWARGSLVAVALTMLFCPVATTPLAMAFVAVAAGGLREES